jgi:hypothetical protein
LKLGAAEEVTVPPKPPKVGAAEVVPKVFVVEVCPNAGTAAVCVCPNPENVGADVAGVEPNPPNV